MQGNRDTRDPINDDGQGGNEDDAGFQILFDHYGLAIHHRLYLADQDLRNAESAFHVAKEEKAVNVQEERQAFSEALGYYIVTENLTALFGDYIDQQAAERSVSHEEVSDTPVKPELMAIFFATFKGKVNSTLSEFIALARDVAEDRFGIDMQDSGFVQGVEKALASLSPFHLSPAHNLEMAQLLRIHATLQNSHRGLIDAISDAQEEIKKLKGWSVDVSALGFNIAFNEVINHFAEGLDGYMQDFARIPQEEFERQLFAHPEEFFNADAIMDGKTELDYAEENTEMEFSPAYYEVLDKVTEELENLLDGMEDDKNISSDVDDIINDTASILMDECGVDPARLDEEAILSGIREAVYWVQKNFPKIVNDTYFEPTPVALPGIVKIKGHITQQLQRYIQ